MPFVRINPPVVAPAVSDPAPRRRPATSPTAPAALPTSNDYEVGYRRPPKHAQFKPGQSGNPRGRPKKAKGVNTIIREQLLQTIAIQTPQGRKRVTKVEALVLKTTEAAAKGNQRALLMLLDMYRKAVPDVQILPDGAATAADLSVTDELTLSLLRTQIAIEQSGNGGGER